MMDRCILPPIGMRLLFGIWCCTVGLAAWAQPRNPFDTPEGQAQGRALFQTHCSYCHGARGEGGRGADLTTGHYRRGGEDANLFATVRNGIPGTEMPAVRVTDDEVWKLVAFVKFLGTMPAGERGAGNVAAGKQIFEGKGKCTQCHSIGPEGPSLGPDLSDVGRRRDLQYIEESLLRPEADVPVKYRAVEVVTKSGESVRGIRLNEDDISIQVRDGQERLRSFLKEIVREIRRDKPSMMPAFGPVLSKREIEDLVAFLSSLRGLP